MKQSRLGFGIVGSLDLATVRTIAERAEELGIHALWVNDSPPGNSLERLEAAAAATTRLHLATGVIAVDRKPAQAIVAEVAARNLPMDRLTIGIGSAAGPSPLGRVRENLAILRETLGAPVVVGALGPRMRRLGAEASDGLLFNWLTPRFALETTREMRELAAAADNPGAQSATYIRTALGADALPVLEDEAARYSGFPAYAANFARLGISAMETAVHADTPEGIVDGILAFDGAVDHAVVRAITPTHDVEHYLQLLDAIAPLAAD
jgi:alkanesulfonate monooxygenase SsuD/methylene tetrahydromethanopterin reductase-like flavin-dependent oxidoreductase (luciferase family)